MKRFVIIRLKGEAKDGSNIEYYGKVIECRVTPAPERLLKIIQEIDGERACVIYPMDIIEKVTDIQREEDEEGET